MSTDNLSTLADAVTQLAALDTITPAQRNDAEAIVQVLLNHLNDGSVRAASRDDTGAWRVHPWVKQGLLLGFKIGMLTDQSCGSFPFFDKHTFPLKPLTPAHGVRLVPGGSAVRTGAYLAPGVICMPPMYVNAGAYVDRDTMIDSHALVGSCAQVGKRVHVSAAAQIGGVLEPPGARPVIIEDDVFIGGGCGVYEGILVREGAVLAPGVILTAATRILDLVQAAVHTEREVPPGAVIVPGSRELSSQPPGFPKVSVYAPLIIKYRDAKTDAATALESALR